MNYAGYGNDRNTPDFIRSHRKLLSETEEIKLFQEWKSAPEGSILKARLLERIVLNFTPVVRKAMRELSGYHIDPEELSSEGLLALTEAAHRFEIEKGFRFSTYAKSWVKGVMLGYITRNYFSVNVCTNQLRKKLFFSMRRFISAKLKENDSFEMSTEILEQLAAQHEVPVEELIILNNLFRRPSDSLSEPVNPGEGETTTRGDMMDSGEMNPEEQYTEATMTTYYQELVWEAMDSVLDPREYAIIRAQVLQEKSDQATLEQLGSQFGISKERIRQIRNRAKTKLTKEITKLARRTELF